MSTLQLGTVQSNTTSPPTIANSSGTEIGTFCRAWVNFNGTGTVAIRASFNVTSITDNNVGDYTINFTTAMPDANYVVSGSTGGVNDSNVLTQGTAATRSTSSCRVISVRPNTALEDASQVNAAFFR